MNRNLYICLKGFRHLTALVGFMLLFVLQLQLAGVAQNQPGFKLEPTRSYYLLGNPIKVFFSMRNTSKQDAFFSMNSFRLPDLTARLMAPNGELLEPDGWNRYGGGIQGATGFRPVYPYKAGDEVAFSLDVDELFVLAQTGRYKLELLDGNTVLANTQIRLISSEVTSRSKFSGVAMTFSRLSIQPAGSVSVLLEGHIVVNKAIVDGKNEWLLNIEGNKVAKREASNLFEPFPVLANTTIQKTALDIKGQLWIVLKAGDKQSLVIWNLATGVPNAVIPWQSTNIQMTIVSHIVIAGIEGQTKVSTLSYGVEMPQSVQGK